MRKSFSAWSSKDLSVKGSMAHLSEEEGVAEEAAAVDHLKEVEAVSSSDKATMSQVNNHKVRHRRLQKPLQRNRNPKKLFSQRPRSS